MKKLDIIFDTDVGADCDDMLALTYLVYAKKHYNVDLKAVTHSKDDLYGIPAIRAFFRTLGEDIPPIGRMNAEPVEYSKSYAKAVAEKFCTDEDFVEADEAVKVLRRALCNSENAILCAVGPFTNIAALLRSGSDEISELDGVSLVKEKCAKVVVMAGQFVTDQNGDLHPEWNVKCDVPAAQAMTELCPIPIVFLPFETGEKMMTGAPMVEKYGEGTPLSLSFVKFGSAGGRHSWDPATVLYAVEGAGDRFDEGPCGRVAVDSVGRTVVNYGSGGMHSVLTVKMQEGLDECASKKKIAEYLDSCVMQVYDSFNYNNG